MSIPARVLHAIQKLTFLKIIFLDIGISLGNVGTDMAQGLSMILQPDWSLAPTAHYGMIVLLICWLPAPLNIIHLSHQQRSLAWLPYRGLPGLFLLSLLLLIFPILPTLLYVGVLLTTFQEKRAREVKAITGVIESPLQLVMMGYLMLKGILLFPLSHEVSNFCIEDVLDRRLCLPSIPTLSIFFSLASILKVLILPAIISFQAMLDMNLSPLLNNQFTFRTVIGLYLTEIPFYIANVVFR